MQGAGVSGIGPKKSKLTKYETLIPKCTLTRWKMRNVPEPDYIPFLGKLSLWDVILSKVSQQLGFHVAIKGLKSVQSAKKKLYIICGKPYILHSKRKMVKNWSEVAFCGGFSGPLFYMHSRQNQPSEDKLPVWGPWLWRCRLQPLWDESVTVCPWLGPWLS